MIPKIGLAIGTRYMFGYRGRLLVRFFPPIIAISFSVATIIMVLNVSNGMIAGIVTKFIETGLYHIRAESDEVYDKTQLQTVRQTLLANPFIEQVGFEYHSVALLAANNRRQGVSVRAISTEVWQDDPTFKKNIIIEPGGEGRLSQAADIMIGSHLAQQLQIEVGDSVELISLNRSQNFVVPRISRHRVQAVFSAGYRDLDRLWVLLPFEHARQSLAASGLRTVVGVKLRDPFSLANPLIRGRDPAQATQAIGEVRRELSADFDVQSWFQARAGQFLSFRSTKNILLFIMLLIIAVAMLHLISALNTLVLDRQAEIAYLSCIGASGGDIRLAFISCGFYIGLGGGALGVLLGLLASLHINLILRAVEWAIATAQRLLAIPHGINLELLRQEFYLEQIPITLSFPGLIVVFCATLLLAVASAFIPARRSMKISPMQMLSDRRR